MTDMFHLKAIETHLESRCAAQLHNTPEGREGMALGQYIAGMGFSNVGLGHRSLAWRTPLGALYDTPHGVACAIILPTGHGVQRGLPPVRSYRDYRARLWA